jgi:UDP-N-acetylglucosamine--N-acetylmuramyl-(pentapeptide) pyrophosphoryl-undecaprenol N-acetylglucosamine transferase
MDLAYAAADIIVSRAGATSISELAIVGKPAVLVPSPNVAEDHQTKNAENLSSHSAAILLPDSMVSERLLPCVKDLLNDAQKRGQLSKEILRFAKANATRDIVEIAYKCIKS